MFAFRCGHTCLQHCWVLFCRHIEQSYQQCQQHGKTHECSNVCIIVGECVSLKVNMLVTEAYQCYQHLWETSSASMLFTLFTTLLVTLLPTRVWDVWLHLLVWSHPKHPQDCSIWHSSFPMNDHNMLVQNYSKSGVWEISIIISSELTLIHINRVI